MSARSQRTPIGPALVARLFAAPLLGAMLIFCQPAPVCLAAQAEPPSAAPPADPLSPAAQGEQAIATPRTVTVTPQASDADIAERLTRILRATGWFTDVRVRVDSGVVFLDGVAREDSFRSWAERLAENTQDVVAVVNGMAVAEKPIWNLAPAGDALEQLARDAIGAFPLILVGALVAVAAYWLARLAMAITGGVARRRMKNVLLQQVAASVVGVIVFLLGLYIALKVSGLTRLAVTVLGGTGLVGLALGFAFRDIAENYLASILISLNHPFRVGDLIQVGGVRGFVRRVTTRGTVLVTIEGDHVQIPNSMVYKSTVTNFSASPASRLEFRLGIGFDDSIAQAQHLAMEVIRRHPATLADPEPLVLVDALGSATVNLVCYLWYDRRRFLDMKVKSALIRQVKQALRDGGISMPDEAREVVFPAGVPVRMLAAAEPPGPADVEPGGVDTGRADRIAADRIAGDPAKSAVPRGAASMPAFAAADGQSATREPASSEGEGELRNDADEITRRADAHDLPDRSINLLE